MSRVIVAGGGAAGMMAAIAAAENGHRVRLFEKNEKLGKKLFITGKGRCNVTNACDTEALFQNVVTNPKFLYSAFYDFDNRGIMALLEAEGCPLKTERGNRVFPVSDHSSDVIKALRKRLDALGVEILLRTPVKGLWLEEESGCGGGGNGRHVLSLHRLHRRWVWFRGKLFPYPDGEKTGAGAVSGGGGFLRGAGGAVPEKRGGVPFISEQGDIQGIR